jgi:hypothetical protein
LMEVTSDYSKKWRFDFNYDKSAVVIFENARNSAPLTLGVCTTECICGHHWKLGDKLIVETDVYKYLGIELDKKLTFKLFKNRIADKARKSRTKIWNMGMRNGALSVKASIQLWESVVGSNLEYGAEVWGAEVGGSRRDSYRAKQQTWQ